jgi:N-sulfoglucosamine sulfohydrolase
MDGRSFVPLLKGEKQDDRNFVFTQIDKKAGNAAVPMRAIQSKKFIYIYNAFSEKDWYKNNNEGQTMKAMVVAAQNNEEIADRVKHFRHRIQEEFYDLEKDPDCLLNLVDNPEYKVKIEEFKTRLKGNMTKTNDPLLSAFENMDNRQLIDQVLVKVYGKSSMKNKKPSKKKR